jgi:hypothetical protein
MTKVRSTKTPTVQHPTELCSPSAAGELPSPKVSEPATLPFDPLQHRLPSIETLARPYEKNLPYAFNHLEKSHHQFRDYIAPKTPHGDSWKTAVYPQSARYHGPTNFSTIFAEDKFKHSKDLLKIGHGFRKHPGAWVLGQPLRKPSLSCNTSYYVRIWLEWSFLWFYYKCRLWQSTSMLYDH